MQHNERCLLQAANLIRQQLVLRRNLDSNLYLPDRTWAATQRLLRQSRRAQENGWLRASRRLGKDLHGQINRCCDELECLALVLQQRASDQPLPSEGEIYREILSLRQEFGEVDCSLQDGELFVVTEPITLRDIDLGRFAIRLDWNCLPDGPCYRVVALDPNPATSNSDVTHPHVRDEHLCEGEGRAAIRTALDQGRIYDFFLLVARILDTYAVGSAYVELAHWQGAPCCDCGESVRDDERYGCSRCGDGLCEDCGTNCSQCDCRHCAYCMGTCPSCQRACCLGCLELCSQCKSNVCTHCWSGRLCKACQAQQAETAHEAKPENASAQRRSPRRRAASTPAAVQRAAV